jgi:hypothetical protein
VAQVEPAEKALALKQANERRRGPSAAERFASQGAAPRTYTRRHVADALHVHINSISRLVAQGRLEAPGIEMSDGLKRWTEAQYLRIVGAAGR